MGGTKSITLTAQWTEYLAKGYQIRAIYEDDFQILSDYTKPIQDQVKGATEYTVEPYEGVTTKGGNTSGTKGTRNSNAIALIGQDEYATLSEAVTAASDGDTIVLQQDYALPSALIINKNITLDLNGHTLTCACKRDLKKRIEVASSAEVTITGGSDAASPGAIVNGEALTAEDESGSSMIKSEGNLTFENVSIASGDTCVWAKAGVLNIDDGVTITSTYSSAVATNDAASGSATYSNGAVIHINGGTITSTNSIAVYVPAGTFYISGGNIAGATGVYMKGGILSITGGTITGTGEDTAYVHLVGDAKPTGDALVIDVCGYPFGADPAISVTGGTFTSEHADAVGSYAADGYTAKAGFLSGGEYSSEPSSSYLAEDFSLVQNASGKWTIDHNHDFNFATQTPTWSWRRVNGTWSAASIYTCECGATEEVAASTAESTSAGIKTITATDTYDHTDSRTEELSYTVTYEGQTTNCNWGDLVTFEADGPRAGA